MKKSLGVIFASLIVLCGLAATSSAQTERRRPRNINQRQDNQQDRIARGIKTGELTAREAVRLERQQAQFARTERRYRRSGDGLSARERARLQRDLNRQSRRIYAQKHDRQDQ